MLGHQTQSGVDAGCAAHIPFRAKSFLLDVSAGLMAEVFSATGYHDMPGHITPREAQDLAPGPFLLIWDKFEDLSEQI